MRFGVQKNDGSIIILGLNKNFGSDKFLCPENFIRKIFWVPKNLGPKNFESKKIEFYKNLGPETLGKFFF